MASRASKAKFGTLLHIGQTDFIREVSQASNECDVVVHLYQNRFRFLFLL
jgi:hypothetical protein